MSAPRNLALALLTLLTLLLGARAAHAQGLSPGPLSSDHKALEGEDQCLNCHSSGATVSAAKCTACHKALGARIAAGAGYHASLSKDCASCHADHRGTGVPLVRWPGGDRDKIDHKKLMGWELKDAHAKVACGTCHKPKFQKGSVARLLSADERPRSYLGLSTECSACHADPHKPSLGTACEKCHDSKTWTSARSAGGFDHGTTTFPLRGAHAKVGCAKCHGGTDAKLADLHPRADTCATCHQDPHGGKMGAATSCKGCHSESSWKPSTFDKKLHEPKTFPLAGGHARPACATCHAAKLDKLPAVACVGCHTDAHKPSLGTDCKQCHNTTAWSGSGKARDGFHDKTSFPLVGLHATVACAKCHDPKKPAARRFRPIAHDACTACHKDPHLGEASKTCEGCHDLKLPFAQPTFDLAEHAATAFPLAGAHAAVPCSTCHAPPPASPGFRKGAQACEACHADPHAGQFAGRAGGCAGCHDQAAWAPSTFTKAAHQAAGFALAGEHDVACGRCHAATTPGTPATFVGMSTDCGACHDDEHAGQFAGRACTSCHASDAFTPTVGFDHAATFALRGRHASAACAACHPDVEISSKPTAVFALGALGKSCVTCHRAQHGDPNSPRALPRKLAAETQACEACHDERSWRSFAGAMRFDHDTTGAPLVGGHAKAPCASCHAPGRSGAVPALEDCTACHEDRHRGTLGDRCESCHSAASWKPDATLTDHQRTRLPLEGAHAVQGCPTCHQDAAAGDFRGLSPACAGCHEHTVVERAPHPPHTGAAFAACEGCHSSLGWRPAYFDHARFWPLTGRHTSTACSGCHEDASDFGNTPTTCRGCHQGDADGASVDHDQFGTTECDTCHTTSGWTPASFPDHTPIFPLRGEHDAPCTTCHTTPGMFEAFTCFGCHEHDRGPTDRHHDEVSGYSYDSAQCYRCHPRGNN